MKPLTINSTEFDELWLMFSQIFYNDHVTTTASICSFPNVCIIFGFYKLIVSLYNLLNLNQSFEHKINVRRLSQANFQTT